MPVIPFAAPSHFVDRIQKDPGLEKELWFIFKGSKLLVSEEAIPLPLACRLYLGTYKEFHVYAAEAESALPRAVELRQLFGKMDEDLLALAGRASQLVHWDRTHQFCGRCGAKTADRPNERAKECPSCKLLAYPKISPVIITAVKKGEEILLARGPHFPMPFFSALAGFVDPGETLEQCVKREVFEEVGLQVDEIRYFASQPWPFPHSLMIAFTCQWQSGEIKIDPVEIAEAYWFKKDNLPLLPPPFSIGRILIDACFNEL